MLDGFSHLFVQFALLLALAVLVGVVVGHYAWPRRPAPKAPVAPPPAPAEAEASARLAVTEQRLAESEARLAETGTKLADTRRKLSEAHAEVLRMSARAQAMADQKEAEMGRLESGAIAALESTIATHREQVTALELQLHAAEETVKLQQQQLDAESRRAAQLQAALAERDAHVATLMSGRRESRS
jgi:hypothetical protein